MNDKEMAKDLKDLASIVKDVLVNRTDIGYIPDLAFPIAKEVLKHYQLKIPKDSVVLSREEYEYNKELLNSFRSGDTLSPVVVENHLQSIKYERKRAVEKIDDFLCKNDLIDSRGIQAYKQFIKE